MAGKRQHFVPRFLQAGFASRRDGDKVFTWVYRKGQPARECSTKDVGLESDFYSTPGGSTADDAVTDAEGTFSALVGSLRDSTVDVASHADIPALIAHLEVRTRHLRQTLLQAGGYMMSGMASLLGDTEAFCAYFERRIKNDPSFLRKPLAEKMGQPLPVVEALLARLLPEGMNQVVKPVLPLLAEEFRRGFPQRLAAAAKAGHIRALKENVSPALKAERFSNFAYATVEVAAGDMILGDSIVLFEVEGPRRYKTLLEGKDVLKAVYVPLAPAQVLVGASALPSSVGADLRDEVGLSSFEYFISHEESDANAALQQRIGENAPLLSPEEMDEIMNEVMNS